MAGRPPEAPDSHSVAESSDTTERARGGRVEGQRVKVGFSLLQMRLVGGTFLLVFGNKRDDRQLRERD